MDGAGDPQTDTFPVAVAVYDRDWDAVEEADDGACSYVLGKAGAGNAALAESLYKLAAATGSKALEMLEDDEAPRAPVKERQERSTRARRAEIDYLLKERSDAPVEVGSGGHDEALGTGQRAARRERRRKEQREQEAYEEDAFRRIDTNKKKKKRRKTADFASSLDDLI